MSHLFIGLAIALPRLNRNFRVFIFQIENDVIVLRRPHFIRLTMWWTVNETGCQRVSSEHRTLKMLPCHISEQRIYTFRVLIPCKDQFRKKNIGRANYPISVKRCAVRICHCHGSA